VDLRLLCDELGVEAAAARAEAQRRQLELGQVIGERDQSQNQAAEAESRAEALGGQLAEVSTRAGALAKDLAVAVGSAQSDLASFLNSCLKNSVLAICRVRVSPQRVRQGTCPGG
jgi:hypothetical protein